MQFGVMALYPQSIAGGRRGTSARDASGTGARSGARGVRAASGGPRGRWRVDTEQTIFRLHIEAHSPRGAWRVADDSHSLRGAGRLTAEAYQAASRVQAGCKHSV
jgi:hypothetical protein